MQLCITPKNLIAMAIAVVGLVSATNQAFATATSFVTPGSWGVGDANTTYQEWDTNLSTTGNTPDVGLQVSPAISTSPTLNAVSPGFLAGSGNFYSFSGNYSVFADIYNHGGTSGTGGLPAGSGTHVIVQTSTWADGLVANTLELVDLVGNPITGGDNTSALRHDVITEGTVSSSFGDVTQREEIWEFFLPGYVDDFRVQSDVSIHAAFDQLRVDTAIGQSAFATTAIPEPASLALLAAGGVLTLARRRRGRA